MPKFVLEKIEAIDGNQVLEKLLIDDKCQFDEFEAKVKKMVNLILS